MRKCIESCCGLLVGSGLAVASHLLLEEVSHGHRGQDPPLAVPDEANVMARSLGQATELVEEGLQRQERLVPPEVNHGLALRTEAVQTSEQSCTAPLGILRRLPPRLHGGEGRDPVHDAGRSAEGDEKGPPVLALADESLRVYVGITGTRYCGLELRPARRSTQLLTWRPPRRRRRT